MRNHFVKAAAGVPRLRTADCGYNGEQLAAMIRQADSEGVKVLCLPELCVTGYTCGDLFFQDALLRGAQDALARILEETVGLEVLAALGMPVKYGNKLYNCAVIIQKGVILAVIPKTHLPNYGEFYEARWFAPGLPYRGQTAVLCGQEAPFGTGVLLRCSTMPELCVGVEVCEDLWAPQPPSGELARAGATVILNLSASNDVAGKADYRRNLVVGQSARLVCGYLYAGAGEGESTTDLVFGGDAMAAENGVLLARDRFRSGLTATELDVGKLEGERQRMNTVSALPPAEPALVVPFELTVVPTVLTRPISPTPFVPDDPAGREERCRELLDTAALGLAHRLRHAGAKTAVLGLSGGLDSTLALLITAAAFDRLGRDRRDLLAVTMPCFGTTQRTRSNAEKLAGELGAALRTVDLTAAVTGHFADIGQPPDRHDAAYENAQARERTQVLMDLANMTGGLVVGTGDLSELALGWATYNGDHMSMYGVNASIPKTLVRYLVEFCAAQAGGTLETVLRDVLDTPVSPELLPPKDGEIAQRTEELVGPYELHDFFLYYVVRWGFSPRKVLRLAEYAMGERYNRETILKWLRSFYRRFFAQQFKRSCLPDGPKLGTVGLSPRGDWRMPSDAAAALWLAELDGLE